MQPIANKPHALFITPDGQLYPDTLVCSGTATHLLAGEPCPYSQDGGMPAPVPLCLNDVDYSLDKGQPGDLCPPCAKQNLSNLGHWQGHGGQTYPEALLPLRLFKCWQCWLFPVYMKLTQRKSSWKNKHSPAPDCLPLFRFSRMTGASDPIPYPKRSI